MDYKNEVERSFLMLQMCIDKNLAPESYGIGASNVVPSVSQTKTTNYRKTNIYRNIEKKWEEVWKNERMNQNSLIGNIQINRYHFCYDEDCQNNGFISKRGNGNVFQCMKSGSVHICDYKNSVCPNVITTNEGNLVCYISGFDIGTTYKGENEFGDNDPMKHGSFVEDSEQQNVDQFSKFKKTSKKRIFTNEYAQPKFKKLDSPKQTNKNFSTNINILSLFDSIIRNVIYDIDKRKIVNKKKRENIEKKWKCAFSKYISNCIETFSTPNLIDLANIHINITNKYQYLKYVKIEELGYKQYTRICHNLWLIYLLLNSHKNNTKIQAIKFIFGFIYLMRDLEEFLDDDKSIFKNLPLQNEIHLFSNEYNVSIITDGNNIIKTLIIRINSKKVTDKYIRSLLEEIYEYIDKSEVDISHIKKLFN